MCYLCNQSQALGVIPVADQNAPTPPHSAADLLQKPDFIREYELQLIKVRQELADLWASRYDVKYGSKASDIPSAPYGPKSHMTVSAMERDAEYDARRRKLEEREAALMAVINQYKLVASLGDAPAEEDADEPAEKGRPGETEGVGSR